MSRPVFTSYDAIRSATQYLATIKAAVADTQNVFGIRGDGRIEIGAGGSVAPDSFISRKSGGSGIDISPALTVNGSAVGGTASDASTSVKGITMLDTAPAVSTSPIAVGVNSTVLPGPTNVSIPIKQPARVCMWTNVTLTAPGATLDGVTMVSGDRVLLVGQTTGSQNGLYVWNGAASTMTRTTDADVAAELFYGFAIQVIEGALYSGAYIHVTSGAITLGTTALVFRELDPGTNEVWQPEDHGLLAWSHDPTSTAAAALAPTSGQLQFIKVKWRRTRTITGVAIVIDTTAGATFTANSNYFGVYDSLGNRLGASTDAAAQTAFGATGFRQCALSGTITPTGGAGVNLYVAFVVRATTLPLIARINPPNSSTGNANLTVSNGRYLTAGTVASGAGSLPATITLASNAFNTQFFWVGLY